MKKDKIAWHPGFCAAMELALRENRTDFIFEQEHNLSREPIRIDLLVIKKHSDRAISNKVAYIFKRFNVIEYKSPKDSMNIDDFFKAIAYTCLYKCSGQTVDAIPVREVTLSMVQAVYPRRLMKLLKLCEMTVEEKYPGIYYVSGKLPFDIQIIVSGRLEQQENIWLKSLVDGIDNTTYSELLNVVSTLSEQGDVECADAVLEVVSGANYKQVERWKEESEMCPTLKKLFAPELALAREEAMAEGKAEGKAEGLAEGKAAGLDLLVEATQFLRNGGTVEELREAGQFDNDIIKKALLLR